MANLTLTKTRLIAGVWEGELTGAGSEPPVLVATHLDQAIDGLQLVHEPTQDIWQVRLPVPSHLISDGVQTFVIWDGNGTVLDSFSLISGEALAEDIRAELNLLRSELDMLKQSFRRHCNET